MNSNLSVYLETQKPIKFNNIIIYQPSLDEILEYDIDKYNMLILPFLLDVDDFEFMDNSLIQNVNIFDILILDSNSEIFRILLDSISFFCKTDEIGLDGQKGVLYIGDGVIDRNNFSEFAEIILQLNAKQKPKKEIPLLICQKNKKRYGKNSTQVDKEHLKNHKLIYLI